jgi:hypothetical protein
LLLPGRRAVHTIGLHYPVDVLFCDGVGRILRIEPELPPCRIVRERRARQVWQLCAGGAGPRAGRGGGGGRPGWIPAAFRVSWRPWPSAPGRRPRH